MKDMCRALFAFAGVGGVLAVVVVWLAYQSDSGLDVMAREAEHGHDLDDEMARIQERFEAVENLVDDVVTGERSLSEAAREDRRVHEDAEITLVRLRQAFGGDSRDEVFCRHLLIRAASRLWYSPKHYRVVMPRLELELRQRYPNTPVLIHPCLGPIGYRDEVQSPQLQTHSGL